MKNVLFSFAILALLLSCKYDQPSSASFDFFEYTGNDSLFEIRIASENQYRNPILSGFYPDPSICRKNDDFFLVNSSFAFYPGIPIFTSKNLVHWTQIGHVLDRPSQLNLDSIRISGGIYAPAIAHNQYNDTFYLITTCVDGIGNFLVKTKDPYMGWSDPIVLPDVGGIDPSLFFDDDGKAYIVNNDAPEGEPQWDGHRAIWIHEFDIQLDKTFGAAKVIVDGGVDKSSKPIWIEGPHLYKRNGKYLLICAEGGTGTQHSEVAFISDSIFGPYIPFKQNPMLIQRDLPEDRENKITSVGHADLIEDTDGTTWAVFLGCRPYEGNYYNTGRETFLLPVEWVGDFPRILPKGEPLPVIQEKKSFQPAANTLTGNFTWRDDFDKELLDMRWLMIRTPRTKWYDIKNGQLILQVFPVSIYEKGQPAFLGHRQQHTTFEVVTKLDFQPKSAQEIAGLVCFQNEAYNIVFGKTKQKGKEVIVVDYCEKASTRIATVEIPDNQQKLPLKLKITGDKAMYNFYLSFTDEIWIPVAENVDGRNLSTERAGGFVGCVIGVYAGKH